MINQIVTPQSIDTNAFADFTKNEMQQRRYFLMSENNKDTFEKPGTKKKHKYTLGVTIGASALIVGFGILALMKGLPKNTYKKLNKWKEALERKTHKLNDGSLKRFYNYALVKVTSFAEKAKGVNNMVSLKDMFYKRVTDKWMPLRKINRGITRLFERLSRRTVVSSYNYTHKKFSSLFENYKSINARILAEHPEKKELIKSIEDKLLKAGRNIDLNFRDSALLNRYYKIKHITRNLQEDFVEATFGHYKNFKKKELYQTFWAENKLNPDKTKLTAGVKVSRDKLSADIDEILAVYKDILSKKEFDMIKNKSHSAVKNLDKSIDVELNQFFDKHRDLVLGSAPTDVLSILGSVGAVGYGLARSKDKDERYSIALKYGIPAVGAIATSLCLSASLVSGGKCMGAALLSGAIINRIGTKLDDFRKSIKQRSGKEQNTPNAV